MRARLFSIFLVLLLQNTVSFGKTGDYFEIASPFNGAVLVRTTIPNHLYPAAGIRVLPPYTLNCTQQSGDYCLFAVSDTMPAKFQLLGPTSAGIALVDLCLNGEGPLSCQRYELPVDLELEPAISGKGCRRAE